MWGTLNQCKAEMVQGLETEAKTSRALWSTATPSPWNSLGTEITYFAVSPSSSWSECSLCNLSQLFSQALEVLLLDNSFQSFYQHSKAPASSLFLCSQRGLWTCVSSREKSHVWAVQPSKNQELFLHISICRGKYLQQYLYSSFLQDYGSLNHPVRKLQPQGQQAVQHKQNPPSCCNHRKISQSL